MAGYASLIFKTGVPRQRLTIAGAVVALCCSTTAKALAQSFNCHQATKVDEIAICHSARLSLLYLQVRKFSGEASIVAVLRLKPLNLLPTLLPVHSAFLSVGNPKIQISIAL